MRPRLVRMLVAVISTAALLVQPSAVAGSLPCQGFVSNWFDGIRHEQRLQHVRRVRIHHNERRRHLHWLTRYLGSLDHGRGQLLFWRVGVCTIRVRQDLDDSFEVLLAVAQVRRLCRDYGLGG